VLATPEGVSQANKTANSELTKQLTLLIRPRFVLQPILDIFPEKNHKKLMRRKL